MQTTSALTKTWALLKSLSKLLQALRVTRSGKLDLGFIILIAGFGLREETLIYLGIGLTAFFDLVEIGMGYLRARKDIKKNSELAKLQEDVDKAKTSIAFMSLGNN